MEDLEKQKLLDEIAMLKKKLNSGGRPQKLDSEKKNLVEQYRLEGKTVKKIAEELNCSMSTINRILRMQKNNKKAEKITKSDTIPVVKFVEDEAYKPCLKIHIDI
jgi:hypothetical protein